ncbi:hypothetical protein Tco_0643276 [Tanacetum coccineum]
MSYPRFTKVVIDHFISKDNTIFMRNKINLHTARDDSLLSALKFVSKTEDCQKYEALIPDGMINDDIKLSTTYKTYLVYASGKVPSKKARKFKKRASPKLNTIPAYPKEPTQKGTDIKKRTKLKTKADKTKHEIGKSTRFRVQRKKKLRIEEEQGLKIDIGRFPFAMDDDDDEESSIPLKDTIISGLPRVLQSHPRYQPRKPVDDSHNVDVHSRHYFRMWRKFKYLPILFFDLIEVSPNCLYSSARGELTLPHSIPPGIDDVNLDPEGDILFLESLLYDNSSPHPPKEFNSKNPTESFSPSPIPVKDSDSLMEEIDIFLDGDDSIPSGIESDNLDSEDDDNSTSRPEFESFHVDYPDLGDSTIDVVEDIPVDVPNIFPTHPALQLDFNFIPSNDLGSDLDGSSPSGDRNKIYDPGICIEVKSTGILAPLSPVIDTLIPFSSENDDKVFNHGVLASKEKSLPSSSHRGLKAFQLSPERPMSDSWRQTLQIWVFFPSLFITLFKVRLHPTSIPLTSSSMGRSG